VSSSAFQNPAALPLGAAALAAQADVQAPTAEEFAAACAVHLDQVWRQLRAMGVAERYLDDATQEVFLVAFHKLGNFDGRAKLGTWLYAIAYRVGCNYRRRAGRERATELVETEHASVFPGPEQSLAERQAAHLVQRFCDGLSEKLRDVFVLCLLEGQPAGEVAQLLGLSENTVYSRIRLAREALQRELERQGMTAT
jgi:RNA polymerase sigma-70 factor (ECF subfamily)